MKYYHIEPDISPWSLRTYYQPHNASAVLRSCECFGIQDVHIIENQNKYEINPEVAMGASKWLSLQRYNETENNTTACLQGLKSSGYTLVATSPHKKSHTPATLPIDKPVALLFGTELNGLSKDALELADEYLQVPMYGFTESLNISVSAAICLFELGNRIRKSGLQWHFSEEEQDILKLRWLKASIKSADFLIERFIRSQQSNH